MKFFLSLEEIVEAATNLNYTKHGEMFSAKNMAKLAQNIFSCQAEKSTETSTLLTSLEKLIQILAIGKLYEDFVRKRALVKYQSQSEVIKAML